MTDKNNSIYAPYVEKNDEPFFMKIGNTTYEVSMFPVRYSEGSSY